MNSLYRDSDNVSSYNNYYARSEPSENCVFCDIESRTIIEDNLEYKNLYIMKNEFPYDFWDMKKVCDHLMIIPVRHIFCMSEMNKDESAEYLSLMKRYSSLGYDVFVRNRNSAIKTIQHLHIHLIKTKERNLGVEVEYSRLDEE
jgi:diadenosine tetraphosphate (Ap4A) HIT family hydrolase